MSPSRASRSTIGNAIGLGRLGDRVANTPCSIFSCGGVARSRVLSARSNHERMIKCDFFSTSSSATRYFSSITISETESDTLPVSKILFITGRGLIQTTIILVIALLIGASFLSPVQYGLTYLVLFLFGVLISAFATTIALYLDDHDSYPAFSIMIPMPLFFTSSALMPYSVMPG